MMKTLKKDAPHLAIYCRVSTTEQSTELQERELVEFAKSRKWKIHKIYRDTATGTNGNRPMFKQLLEDARAKKFNKIVCWKLDRLFRSLKDLLTTLQEFNDLGISFISLKDHIDLSTPTGRLMMHVIGAFAEFEASIIKERVKVSRQ